jgi:acid phosphatase family membrane protein YuiD
MRYLVVPMVAWLVAQGLKHLARLFGRNRRIFGHRAGSVFMLSGGMPSAHSATVVSIAVMIGLGEGWNSALFALSAVLAAVVIYDGVMVRFSSGQQGDALNDLLKEQKSHISPVRVAHGHTLVEVLAGAVIGVVVAVVAFFTTT